MAISYHKITRGLPRGPVQRAEMDSLGFVQMMISLFDNVCVDDLGINLRLDTRVILFVRCSQSSRASPTTRRPKYEEGPNLKKL